MNVLIIGGGKSVEHEVSLVSAAAIARNIDAAKHRIFLAGITQDGRWFLQDDAELARIRNDPKAALCITEKIPLSVIPGKGLAANVPLSIDVVFPALHGSFGEDGTIQGLLEMANVAYAGCGVMASSVTMDKEKTKLLWKEAGLPVVPWVCLRKGDGVDFAEAEKSLAYPLFVKPVNGGSSVGSGRALNRSDLERLVEAAFTLDNKVLIERALDVREVECSVTGDSVLSGDVRVWGCGEIAPSHEFYTYDAKYTDPNGAKLLIPPPLAEAIRERILDLARRAYVILDCSGLARVDFFVTKDTGEIYLNEINTMPGFTPISMFPKICIAAGLSFTGQIDLLIDQAIMRFREKSTLHFQRDVLK